MIPCTWHETAITCHQIQPIQHAKPFNRARKVLQVALLSFESSKAAQFSVVQDAIEECWREGAETSGELWRMIGGVETDAKVRVSALSHRLFCTAHVTPLVAIVLSQQQCLCGSLCLKKNVGTSTNHSMGTIKKRGAGPAAAHGRPASAASCMQQAQQTAAPGDAAASPGADTQHRTCGRACGCRCANMSHLANSPCLFACFQPLPLFLCTVSSGNPGNQSLPYALSVAGFLKTCASVYVTFRAAVKETNTATE